MRLLLYPTIEKYASTTKVSFTQAFFDEMEKLAESIVLYHGTRPSLIEKIMKEGLDPAYTGTGYEGRPDLRKEPAVSLSTKKEHAQAYANLGAMRDTKGLKKLLAAVKTSPSVLTVTVPKNNKSLKKMWDHGVDEWHYHGKISPDWISNK